MSVKLLTEHHLEFLSLKEGCTGSSESTLAKMSHCWKSRRGSHVAITDHDSCKRTLMNSVTFHLKAIKLSRQFNGHQIKSHRFH